MLFLLNSIAFAAEIQGEPGATIVTGSNVDSIVPVSSVLIGDLCSTLKPAEFWDLQEDGIYYAKLLTVEAPMII
jgi:hypothetical protein